jgi:hypothetical protein
MLLRRCLRWIRILLFTAILTIPALGSAVSPPVRRRRRRLTIIVRKLVIGTLRGFPASASLEEPDASNLLSEEDEEAGPSSESSSLPCGGACPYVLGLSLFAVAPCGALCPHRPLS